MTRLQPHAIRAGFATFALIATVLSPACLPGRDGWPQYRGPQRNGVVEGPDLAVSWPDAGPRRLWTADLGGGFSQVVVGHDAAFVPVADEEFDYLARVDKQTGAEAWRVPLGSRFSDMFGDGARSTPTLDGDRVFAIGGNGNLVAVDRRSGSVQWSVNLTEQFEAPLPRFGFSGSPLVIGERVVTEVGGAERSAVMAFDRSSGDVLWSALDGPAGYGSPILFDTGDEPQILLIRGRTLHALGTDGTELWSYAMGDGAIAMPIPIDHERIFVSTGGDWGCALLRVTRDDDGYAVTPLWRNDEMQNHFNSSVVHDGAIYGFDNATLKSLSLEDGALRWARRGFGKGSVAVADGRLFALGDQGLLVMIDTDAADYEELGRVQALEGRSWTSPTLAEGRIYLRNLETMTCLDLTEAS